MKVIDVILRTEQNPCPLVNNRKRRNVKTIVSAITTGLWPFSKISAGVAVLNSAKTGVLSDTVTFDTPEGGMLSACSCFCISSEINKRLNLCCTSSELVDKHNIIIYYYYFLLIILDFLKISSRSCNKLPCD